MSSSQANQALRSLANAGFQNRGVCLQAFPSFPFPSPLFHFLPLVSFLGRPKPRISFLGLSLLRNSTETLATQATLFRIQMLFSTAQAIATLIANYISLSKCFCKILHRFFNIPKAQSTCYLAEESSLLKVISCGSLVPSG